MNNLMKDIEQKINSQFKNIDFTPVERLQQKMTILEEKIKKLNINYDPSTLLNFQDTINTNYYFTELPLEDVTLSPEDKIRIGYILLISGYNELSNKITE